MAAKEVGQRIKQLPAEVLYPTGVAIPCGKLQLRKQPRVVPESPPFGRLCVQLRR